MRRRGWRLAASVLLLCGIAGAARAQPAPPDPAGAPPGADHLLAVHINGEETQWIAAFRPAPDGGFTILPQELRNLGLVPADAALTPEGRIALGRLPGISYSYDARAQSIAFQALDAARIPRAVSIRPDPGAPAIQRPPGVRLNYSLYADADRRNGEGARWRGLSAALDGRAFSRLGALSQSAIAHAGAGDSRRALIRLDTRWDYSDPHSMIAYSAGDVISGAASWARPVRLGGVRIGRSFGLRPDLITMPMPDFSGSAAVPSTLDVFVNDNPVASEQIPAGPFQVGDLPAVSGAGAVRVALTDALGRRVLADLAFYASPAMLAPGLSDFSVQAGYARRGYSVDSADYSNALVGSASLRRGLTNALTLEGHAEAGAGLLNAGAGGAFGLGRHGAGSLSLSASHHDGRTGTQLAGSVRLERASWVLFAQSRRAFGDYEDIASVTALDRRSIPDAEGAFPVSARPARALDQVSLSTPLGFGLGQGTGALNLNLSRIRHEDGDSVSTSALSYSQTLFHRASLFASAYRSLEGATRYGVLAGLSMALGGASLSSRAMTTERGSSLAADLARHQGPAVGDHGWRLRAAGGEGAGQSAAFSYRARPMLMEAGLAHSDGVLHASAQVDGSLVLMDGGVFAANRIHDAFAIVDVGAPDVEVRHAGRPVGRTNRSGRILISSLRSWERNDISIDPDTLPLDAQVNARRHSVTPAEGGGAMVRFRREGAGGSALVSLRDENGAFLEPGAAVTLGGAGEAGEGDSHVVGYDGQAFLHDLGPRNRIAVRRRDGARCVAEFDFTPVPGAVAHVPDVICRIETEA